MTNDEIRKLLGGYATNTLTEGERKSLFEAALENQELFDALQQEQALKELLADPVSRAQVGQALAKQRPVWWSRWWAWSSAASAVAAAVLIVAVVQQGPHLSAPKLATQPGPLSEPPKAAEATTTKSAQETGRIARSQKKRMAEAIPAPTASVEARKDQRDEVGAAAPFPVERAQAPPATPQVARQNQQTPSPSQNQTQTQARAVANGLRDTEQEPGAAGFRLGFAGRVVRLRYSFLKRDASGAYSPTAASDLHAGDAVRLNVSPMTSGYLLLSRFDNSGIWKRIFPVTGPGIPVTVNASYTIPADSAIELTDKEEKLRLTLLPPVPSTAEVIELRQEPAKKAKAAPPPATVRGALTGTELPLVVDITITPKNP